MEHQETHRCVCACMRGQENIECTFHFLSFFVVENPTPSLEIPETALDWIVATYQKTPPVQQTKLMCVGFTLCKAHEATTVHTHNVRGGHIAWQCGVWGQCCSVLQCDVILI